MRTVSILQTVFFWRAGLAPALAADPTGDWRVADGVANIRVAECNGSMWGAVAWEKTPGGRDNNNPDASKQSRPTLGMPILIDMKKKPGVDQWEGQVYNAKDGQIYSSTIKPVGTDQLEIQGCVLGFLCGGETWTRVAGPDPLEPRQQHGQGRAEGHRRAAQDRGNSAAHSARCAEDHRRRSTRLRKPPVRSRRPAQPDDPSAISAYSPTSRGLPISAGWNSSTAASVVTSESASSLPMLAVPG